MSEAPCYGCRGWWVIVFISIQSAWFSGVCVYRSKVYEWFRQQQASMQWPSRSSVPLSDCLVSVFESCGPTIRHQKAIRSENAQDVSVHLKNAREKWRSGITYPEVVFLHRLTSLLLISRLQLAAFSKSESQIQLPRIRQPDTVNSDAAAEEGSIYILHTCPLHFFISFLSK